VAPRGPRSVTDLLRAIHARTRHRPVPYWVGVGQIMDDVRCTDLDQIDRALLYGLERKWVRISSVPAHSVTITRDGIDQIGKG
jgi:hypothetical protein